MARRNRKNKSRGEGYTLNEDAKTSIIAISFWGIAVIFLLSSFNMAGPIGELIFKYMTDLLGIGYYLIPFTLIIIGLIFATGENKKIFSLTIIGSLIFIMSALGLIDVIYPEQGGLIGKFFGLLEVPFGKIASVIIHITILVSSIVLTINTPFKIKFKKGDKSSKLLPTNPEVILPQEYQEPEREITIPSEQKSKEKTLPLKNKKDETEPEKEKMEIKHPPSFKNNYIAPPINLLRTSNEKPTVGDLRANANIIKRTLESFGVPVEMGEITIGPKVTRYTLKPAEGIKLARITALNQDLALALAAHPIRIEAPIPGKALVGIEIPNKTASIVRLGNLISYKDFAEAGQIGFVLGRDVSGEPVFADLAKMPHLLIAGSTGSGKSITIQTLLISLLYKNSPESMRLLLIDPKRVELSIYDGIPHLVTPVITEGKKSVAALRFAIEEMDRRYGALLKAGQRDILSYNEGRKEDIMPYLVIVIDEMADLMATFGREIESYIVRLAQMARATGIHLVVSTQR
ncbi:MAG TPA: DNA translocase FtsK, partial [Candidatus Paceibacterota bacterium]